MVLGRTDVPYIGKAFTRKVPKNTLMNSKVRVARQTPKSNLNNYPTTPEVTAIIPSLLGSP